MRKASRNVQGFVEVILAQYQPVPLFERRRLTPKIDNDVKGGTARAPHEFGIRHRTFLKMHTPECEAVLVKGFGSVINGMR
jgi:hypothetical protein